MRTQKQEALEHVVRAYAEKKGYDLSHPPAYTAFHRRYCRVAAELLAYAKGDYNRVKRAINDIGRHLDSLGMDSWGIDAVARLYPQWDKEERDADFKQSARAGEALIKQLGF